jgi:hypothetical protein
MIVLSVEFRSIHRPHKVQARARLRARPGIPGLLRSGVFAAPHNEMLRLGKEPVKAFLMQCTTAQSAPAVRISNAKIISGL